MKTTRWQLDNAAFEALLTALHRDRSQASEEYERVRQSLVRFFTLHGALAPEDLADEALNRLARKLSEGENIRSVSRYLGGIARIVLREEWHTKLREEQALRDGLQHTPSADDGEGIGALENCLAALTPERRALIQHYYSAEGRARIEARRQMAREFGISLNTLRNRALRIREELEECYKKSPGDR
ncbi:MAG: RNA polymerase sigma factor [Terriglobia bacterium]